MAIVRLETNKRPLSGLTGHGGASELNKNGRSSSSCSSSCCSLSCSATSDVCLAAQMVGQTHTVVMFLCRPLHSIRPPVGPEGKGGASAMDQAPAWVHSAGPFRFGLHLARETSPLGGGPGLSVVCERAIGQKSREWAILGAGIRSVCRRATQRSARSLHCTAAVLHWAKDSVFGLATFAAGALWVACEPHCTEQSAVSLANRPPPMGALWPIWRASQRAQREPVGRGKG